MSVWICGECTAAYAPGMPTCPQCTANDPIKEDEQLAKERENMPKTTVHNGASDENAEPGQPGYVEPENTEQTGEPGDGGEEPGGDETEAVDYNAFTVDELRAELADRDLPVSGNKAELVERLAQNDQDRAKAAETEQGAE
ncbi:SAP domain-containing protein [Amycolatopsis sp. NPDC004378]